MLLQAPAESPYDIRFHVFGIPVRVSWTFWLGAAIFGYGLVDGFDRMFGNASPGRAPLLLLWGLCILVSILIHELGHAFAFWRYGIRCSIVLYHFGGLAIPVGTSMPGFSIGRSSERQDLFIALAGPLAQLLSAVVVAAIVKLAGYRLIVFALMPGGFDRIPGLIEGAEIDSVGLLSMVSFYIFPSVLWALLNLIPVWPLDGGRIMRSLVLMTGGDESQSLWISVIAAAVMVVVGFQAGHMFLGILFLSLAITNYQMLQHRGGW